MGRAISRVGLGWMLALGTTSGCASDPRPGVFDAGSLDLGATTDQGSATDTGADARTTDAPTADAVATDAATIPDSGAVTDASTDATTDTTTATDASTDATGDTTTATDASTDAATGSDATAGSDAARAALAVTSPAAGASLAIGAPTQLTLAVTNFALVNFMGAGANAPNTGHVHVYLDANDGSDYLVADYIVRPRVVIPSGTTAGAHTLRVSLRNHDHSALTPPIEVRVPFTAVAGTAPSVTITSPGDNTAVVAGADLTLALAFMNFTARDFAGQTGVSAGFGHYHVYLDGASGSDYLLATYVPNPAVRIPAATSAGTHRLTVSLRNDDHSEIVGAAVDMRIDVIR